MAAEAFEPEISGSRVHASGIRAPTRPCEASTATTPNILFYLVVCRSTSSRAGRSPGAAIPQFG
jgi:hypothetical protein